MSRVGAWALAVRPRTLLIAWVPVLVGSFLEGWPSHALLVISALVTATLLTIATNLINDALDFMRGADTPQRLGPLRVSQAGLLPVRKVFIGGMIALTAAALCSWPMVVAGGMWMGVVVGISLLCSYLYTGGPFPFAYHGLGEPFAFIFYGIVAVGASSWLQKSFFTLDSLMNSLVAGSQIGLLAVSLLAINNTRDMAEDSRSGKRTWAVRRGLTFARSEVTGALLLPLILGLYWAWQGRWMLALLPCGALTCSLPLLQLLWTHNPSPLYNQLLARAAIHLALFGLLFLVALSW